MINLFLDILIIGALVILILAMVLAILRGIKTSRPAHPWYQTRYTNKTLPAITVVVPAYDEERHIENIVNSHNIDRYQQERMKIDIMYKHPDNKRVVDEYRDILLGGIAKDTFPYSEYAKLRRLRTLGIRNDIPIVLFETLDELLLKGQKVREIDEPEYLKETRSILQSLFFKDPSLRRHLIEEDIIRLLKAKQLAYAQGDKAFEQILLETVRACDEISHHRPTGEFSQ